MPLYIFVDWAGDPGFRFRAGSSRLLVVSAVVVHDYDAWRTEFSVLRNRLGNSPAREFHFVDTSARVRAAFFEMAEQITFHATIAVVEKKNLARSFVEMGGAGLVNYFIAETIAGSERTEIENAIVMLDGARDETRVQQAGRVALSRALAARDADYFVKRFTVRPAREEDGLQLADMLAGFAMSLYQEQRSLPKRLQAKITLRAWG